MKKIAFIIFITLFLFQTKSVSAITNPLNSPNNKVGIHILFPHELDSAALLVNSSGGDYGYVTIAIQAGDKDRNKWQNFLNVSKQKHLIPIIRIATEADLKNTAVWRKPTDYDIVDFANFLNSLDWPYKNRYIVVFNEVNRGDEWGGHVDPYGYAEILNYAVTVFKSRSHDFFIISAGLDNAAPNKFPLYMNQYNYLVAMNTRIPGIFNQIDGFASHSYPNPGFSQLPTLSSPSGANSFQFEKSLIKSLSGKNLPIFITETGWSSEVVHPDNAAKFYQIAFNTIWNDENIVAVTPFLLQGSGGPFQKFTFMDSNGLTNTQYNSIKNYPKIKGNPELNTQILGSKIDRSQTPINRVLDFSDHQIKSNEITVSAGLKSVFKWLLKL